jgi:hypothetical protein
MSTSRLLALPAELRNTIYEFTFAPSDKGSDQDFFHPSPPTKSLILTCRQIHNAAVSLYCKAYRAYWNDSNFVIKMADFDTTFAHITTSDPSALAHITHLRIDKLSQRLEYDKGLWSHHHTYATEFLLQVFENTTPFLGVPILPAWCRGRYDMSPQSTARYRVMVLPTRDSAGNYETHDQRGLQSALKQAAARSLTVWDLKGAMAYMQRNMMAWRA